MVMMIQGVMSQVQVDNNHTNTAWHSDYSGYRGEIWLASLHTRHPLYASYRGIWEIGFTQEIAM